MQTRKTCRTDVLHIIIYKRQPQEALKTARLKGGTSMARIWVTESPMCEALHHTGTRMIRVVLDGINRMVTKRLALYHGRGPIGRHSQSHGRGRCHRRRRRHRRHYTVVVGTRRRRVGGVRTAGRRADWRRRRDE